MKLVTPDSLPTEPASVIYADPPWGWSQSKLEDRGAARTVEKEYATMKSPRGSVAAEIEALPVGDWAADNAVLSCGPPAQSCPMPCP